MPWLDIRDDLPRKCCDESLDLNKRWGAVGIPDPTKWEQKTVGIFYPNSMVRPF